MRDANYKNAFGGVDPAFDRHVHVTLNKLCMKKERPMKSKMSVSVALVAVLCLLLAGLAVAATNMGLFGRLKGDYANSGAAIPPEVEQLIEHPTDASAESDIASNKITEALYDGNLVFITMEVMPKGSAMLLLPDSRLTDRMSDFGEAFKANKKTIAEYAKANGKDKLYHINFGTADRDTCAITSIDCAMRQDGLMEVNLIGEVQKGAPSELSLEIRCITREYNVEEISDTYIPLKLTSISSSNSAVSDAQTVYDSVGLRIDRVEATDFRLSMVLRIHYTVLAKPVELSESWIGFAVLDENGKPITTVEPGINVIYELDDDKPSEDRVLFEEILTLPARGLPSAITIAAYNRETDAVFEAHTIDLSPQS